MRILYHFDWHGILSDVLRHFLILVRYSGRLLFSFLWSASLCPAQRHVQRSVVRCGSRLCAHLCYAGIAYERRGTA